LRAGSERGPEAGRIELPKLRGSGGVAHFWTSSKRGLPELPFRTDAKDPNVAVLQKARAAERVQPVIPLGSRGLFGGQKFEAIGFQVRTVTEEDGPDSWQEYLLYNPYHGYRYLTEYNGHWNFVRVAKALPEQWSDTRVKYEGKTFTLYSRAEAATSYVIGEFPWSVRVGETARVADFIVAPQVLSSETTADETVWSLGEYTAGADVWKAFRLPGSAPAAQGTFENQPSPHTGAWLWGTAWKLLVAAFVLALATGAMGGRTVFQRSYPVASPSTITPVFDVGGHESNLQVETRNRGAESFYIRYALIDEATGAARAFGRSIGQDDRAVIPSVRPGRYRLRIDLEQAPEQAGQSFDVTVRRHVSSMMSFWITSALLLLPPLAQTWKRSAFERARWQGSSR